MQVKQQKRIGKVGILWDEILQKQPHEISKVSKEVVDVLGKYTLATKIMALASILVCWIERFNLNYANVLGMADCLTHQNKFNNISDYFRSIYEVENEEI